MNRVLEDEVLQLRLKGKKRKEIAKLVGCSVSTIRDIIKKNRLEHKNKIDIEKSRLIELYVKNKLGQKKVGLILGVSGTCVTRNLKMYKIPIRTNSEAQKINPVWKGKTRHDHSQRMKGKNNPNYGKGLFGNRNPSKKLEIRQKISKSKKGLKRLDIVGSKNPLYGKSWNRGKTKKDDPRINRMAKKHSQIMHKKLSAGLMSKSSNTNIEETLKEELIRRGYIITNYENYQKAEDKKNLIVHQCPVFSSKNKIRFNIDFGLPHQNIYIECDGDYWHNREDVKKRDKAKNNYIKKCNWILLRFWGKEIENNVKKCVDAIEETLKSKSSTEV